MEKIFNSLLFVVITFVFSVSATAPENRFKNNGNGTITDTQTGLIWQQDGSLSGKINWKDARLFSSSLRLAGFSDWRLPTIEEMKTLISGHLYNDITRGAERPYAMLNRVGFKNVQDDWYWSASNFDINDGNSWLMHLYFGYLYVFNKIYTYHCYVLSVRSSASSR